MSAGAPIGPSVRTAARLVLRATSLVLLLTAASPGRAQDPDPQDPDLEWTFENVRLRLAAFQQEGRGLQSQADQDADSRGSEAAWIFQPIGSFRLRQDRDTTHDVAIPIDIVTAASPDALDAVSSASRENEAATLDVVDTIRTGAGHTVQVHWGGHFEEYWGAAFLGASFLQSFADDNATLTTGAEVIVDSFDALTPQGYDFGPVDHRVTASVHLALSQLLSPTTIVSGGYTLTGQFGRLETTYNSVPLEIGGRIDDKFPRTRARHSFTGEIRQAIPESRTFFGLSYRFYVDSFDALAHTARATVTQYIGDLWLRGHYRFHHQDSPSFWMPVVPRDLAASAPRTADSDLETLQAHEVGLNARWIFDRRGAPTAQSSFVQLGYAYYWRSNSLVTHIGSIDFGYGF